MIPVCPPYTCFALPFEHVEGLEDVHGAIDVPFVGMSDRLFAECLARFCEVDELLAKVLAVLTEREPVPCELVEVYGCFLDGVICV